MIQIIPAILDTEEESFKKHVDQVSSSEHFKEGWVHIDFMDNIFVPNESIEPLILAKHPINLKKEAHLMVEHPLEWIPKLIEIGFDRIIFHIEAKDDMEQCIRIVKGSGLGVGVAINYETSIDNLEPFIGRIDLVLVMSIVPGFQGQPFIAESLEKIKKLKSKSWPIVIAVDGAVKDNNAKSLIEAGVDNLIVGSYLLEGDINENFERIWEAIKT